MVVFYDVFRLRMRQCYTTFLTSATTSWRRTGERSLRSWLKTTKGEYMETEVTTTSTTTRLLSLYDESVRSMTAFNSKRPTMHRVRNCRHSVVTITLRCIPAITRVHRVLEKSLNFEKNLKVFEIRVGPWKVLESECSIFWNFCILRFWTKHFTTTWL